MPNNTPTFAITDHASAEALVATIKAAVNGAGKYRTFVENNHVTRDMVPDMARALATLAYPNDKQVQKVDGKRTRFGNAVQAAGNGLRNALDKDDDADPKPAVLRVSLSGEGGGSTVVPEDHPMYAQIIALLASEN